MNRVIIREIQPKDNQQVKSVVQTVLVEMRVPKVGTAYEDESLNDMHAEYDQPRMAYFVVEEDEKIIGCAGIAPLKNGDPEVCELQKMYFLPEARGRGIGSQMMDHCLNYAKEQGFKQCYLETLPYMKNAIKLYNRTGFENLQKPMGDTGHYNCSVWMIKSIE